MRNLFAHATTQPNADTNGFAILYTVVIIALITGITAALLGAAFRQTRLVTTSAQSTQALMAADTGLECAMFWDLQKDAFAVSGPSSTVDCAQTEDIPVSTFSCSTDSQGRPCHGREFTTVGMDPQKCLLVKVRKYEANGGSPKKTEINSFGYEDCDTQDIERALRTSY